MSKAAFLIVDMQKNCKEETTCKASFEKAVEYINEISQYFRRKKHPVVIIQDVEAGGSETEGFKCVDELIVSDSDFFVQKSFNNAFWETELDIILKRESVDCVVISGFAAEYCVLFTYNGALERGYNAFLLQNGIAGFSDDEIRRIQLLRSVVSYDALEYFLKENQDSSEHESIKQIWENYLASIGENLNNTYKKYTAWHFCDNEQDANELAELVVSGVKRATASLYLSYGNEEELPKEGDFSIVTDWNGEAQCIIKTTNIAIVPYKDVTEEFAATEGEGDKSLEYWKNAHWSYFSREMKEIGKEPTEDMLVVCEKFEVVFK